MNANVSCFIVKSVFSLVVRPETTVHIKIIALSIKCDFRKTHFSAFIIHRIYLPEGLQLIAEVGRSQFLLIAFISQQAFS